jgi:hypothetical protein
VESGGLGFTISLYRDPDVDITDSDAYSEADIAAWKRDEWTFVTVEVRSDVGGIYDDLGACAFGTGDGWTVSMDRMVTEYPVPDMLSAVKRKMRRDLPAMRAEIDAAIAATKSA